MGKIITLDEQKAAECMQEIGQVLNKYHMTLSPSVIIGGGGIQMKVEVLPLRGSGANMNAGGSQTPAAPGEGK